MHSKFAVIRVKLTYKATEEDKKLSPMMSDCLAEFTRQIFGYAEEIEDLSLHIFLPRNCNLFDLSEMIGAEFVARDLFEGLEFEIVVSGAAI